MRGIHPLVLALFLALVTLASCYSTYERRVPEGSKRTVFKRDGATVTIFEHAETASKMEYVTNSGLCETAPGVKQHSGYLSVGDNMNMWFWFFEARKNASTAPLAAWFNGGPGCSSMIGLFQVSRSLSEAGDGYLLVETGKRTVYL
jgi:carboxypeptidase C (cathepsin A)